MPRFGVSDGLAFHQKALRAGNEALGAWVRAGSWSSAPENLTEGFIPREVAEAIAPAKVWKRLVDVRLVEPARDGYQLHAFLEHNPSAAQVRAERQRWAERQRRSRESRGLSRRDAPRDTLGDPGGVHADPGPCPDPDPDPVSPPTRASEPDVPPAPPTLPSIAGTRPPPPVTVPPPAPPEVPVRSPDMLDCIQIATWLADEGVDFAKRMVDKAAQGRTFTAKERAALRKIAGEHHAARGAGTSAAAPGQLAPGVTPEMQARAEELARALGPDTNCGVARSILAGGRLQKPEHLALMEGWGGRGRGSAAPEKHTPAGGQIKV